MAGQKLEDVGPPMYAPFWCDIQGGTITYGTVSMGGTGAAPLLSKADACVRQGFPLTAGTFMANSLFVATWSDVQAAGGGAQVNNVCVIMGISLTKEFIRCSDLCTHACTQYKHTYSWCLTCTHTQTCAHMDTYTITLVHTYMHQDLQ